MNNIDILIERLTDVIQTSDGSPNCQEHINDVMLLVMKEINKILKTVERDLR